MEPETKKKIALGCGVIAIIALAIFLARNADSWFDNEEYSYSLETRTKIGDHFYKRKNLSEYVLIGIDNTNKIDQTTGSQNADFICYMFADNVSKTYNVLQINRDTITRIDRLSSIDPWASGSSYFYGQIAMSHGYGATASNRNNNVVSSLNYLFNSKLVSINDPLEHFGFTMGAVPYFTKYIGGFDITITSELADANLGLVEGSVLSINENNALDFVRERSDASDPSNIARMRRQKAYMNAYLEKVRNSSFSYKDFATKDDVIDYIETNITGDEVEKLESFASDLSSYTFGSIINLEGTEGVDTSNHKTFTVSQDTINSFLTTYIYDLAE